MTPRTADTAWSTPAFLDAATSWVEAAVRDRGSMLSGEGEQVHVRPWSTAIRFDLAGGGAVWCKAHARGIGHEPALASRLWRLERDLVPEVLALDVERTWSLTADAGPTLRRTVPVEDRWDIWTALLPRYAEAQLRVSVSDDVPATGLPVLTPERLPERLRSLVAELASRPVAHGGLPDEERRRIEGRFADLDAAFAELAGTGLPSSIQHDDLHGGNVCVDGGVAKVIDWGDASWGFPLGTMLVTLDAIARDAACAVEDARVVRVRDAYLEPFTARWDHVDLVRWTGLARRLGALARALSWQAALADAPPSAHEQYHFPQRLWLGWLAD